jgi:hypothetical protein
MKRTFILIMITLLSSSLIAQNEESDADDTIGIAGYISPFFETTSMVQQCYFMGGSGAIFINPVFFIGGFGITMTNYYKTDRGIYSGNELDFGGGGLLGGVVFYHAKKIHPILTIWAGGGSISLSDKDKLRVKDAFDDFYYFNGTIELEYRPIKNLAVGLGGHYQQVIGFKLDGYSESNFCGPGIYFNIKVGLFE